MFSAINFYFSTINNIQIDPSINYKFFDKANRD